MEILVNGFLYMFITLAVAALVISLIEYPEIWTMLLLIVLSPLWLLYKLLKYPIQENNKLVYLKKSSVIKS